MSSFTSVTDDVNNNLASYHAELIAGLQGIEGPIGWIQNGKLAVTVASNNLTVALKTRGGDDPSAANPVAVRIGDTIRLVTSALSVTKNAGTNWCNAGGAELATKEIDYFVYLGYNATDGVVIGFSRIPSGSTYSSFSATSTAETYAAISTITNAAAGDEYVNVGRFAATLSAGAGYTWTVPTFTTANLIQRPVYETRWLIWAPAVTGFSANPTFATALYQVRVNTVQLAVRITGGTSNATDFTLTPPFACAYTLSYAWGRATDNGAALTAGGRLQFTASTTMTLYTNFATGAWTGANTKNADFVIAYPI